MTDKITPSEADKALARTLLGRADEMPLHKLTSLIARHAQQAREEEREASPLAKALGKAAFSMTEPHNPGGNHPNSRKLVLGFEHGDDASEAQLLITAIRNTKGRDDV